MTLRPRRKGSTLGEFEDPLSNYDEPTYADELERAMAEDTMAAMVTTPVTTVSADTSVQEVLRMMIELDIACMLVTEQEHLLGIFSERDVLTKVAGDYAKVKDKPIRDVMTTGPVVVYETASPAKALNLMAVGGFRHVPILDVDDKVVGIVGPRRVTHYLQQLIEKHKP